MKDMTDTKSQMTPKMIKLGGLVKNLNVPARRLILRAKHMGSWMTVRDNMVNVTVLVDMVFRFTPYVTILPP